MNSHHLSKTEKFQVLTLLRQLFQGIGVSNVHLVSFGLKSFFICQTIHI